MNLYDISLETGIMQNKQERIRNGFQIDEDEISDDEQEGLEEDYNYRPLNFRERPRWDAEDKYSEPDDWPEEPDSLGG